MKAQYEKIMRQAKELCREKGAELMFLTVFGSSLYGTAIEGSSDLDIRGSFLPSMESLALGEAARGIHVSTGDGSSRNAAGDVDLDLWSLQRWLLEMLPMGDIGALDLLFSPSNPSCTLFSDARLEAVFASPLTFLNAAEGQTCVDYCMGQAKKYGIRGSRLGALNKAMRWAEGLGEEERKGKLRELAPALAASCADERFCRIEEVRGTPMLFFCGKWHDLGTRLADFLQRLEVERRRCWPGVEGERSIDWKAISHAVRAIRQQEELLASGKIAFPLACRGELMRIKTGQASWDEAEALILDGLEGLEAKRQRSPYAVKPDPAAARAVILSCYGLRALR